MWTIDIWIYDDCLPSAVGGFMDVFATANTLWLQQGGARAEALFSTRLVSADGKPVRASSGMTLTADGRIDSGQPDLLLLPGIQCGAGSKVFLDRISQLKNTLPVLHGHYAKGAMIAANCSASFLLAEAGLLDDRRATVTWWLAQTFRKRYPKVSLNANEILTEDSRLICSGATTAYLTLALYLVERFAGQDLANVCARVLLIDANRHSQAPYIAMNLQEHLVHSDPLVQRAQDWMSQHLRDSFSLKSLAAQVHISPRSLIRRFSKALQTTPISYLQALRIERAKRLLESSTLRLDAIAEQVGYADISSFRRLFRREVGLSLKEYRTQFARKRSPVVGGP